MASPLVRSVKPPSLSALTGVCLLALSLFLPPSAQASGNIHIAKAAWSAAHGLLTVKGRCPSCAEGDAVSVYDSSARLLASGTADASRKFVFAVQDDRPDLLCSIRVKAAGDTASKIVKGTPDKNCAKAPQCQILVPTEGATLAAHETFSVSATAKLKDKHATPLRVEWDFGGGAKRLYATEGQTAFERDNSRYRIRFTAWDGMKRYCEDQVTVTVGTPPAGLPAKVEEQTAPKLGAALTADTVVLPFNDMGMQGGYPTYDTIYPWNAINNLNAQVVRKGGKGSKKPAILTDAEIAVRYSAASSPTDPVGAGSINSSSRNWPLGSGAGDAALFKTDLWGDHGTRPAPIDFGIWWLVLEGSTFDGDVWVSPPVPDDQGKASRHNVEVSGEYTGGASATGQGRRMPGFGNAYAANNPQETSAFLDGLEQFTAEAVPVTNIDDQGRVNNYPLFRVEAQDKASGQVLANADAVVGAAKDFHCRECHLKGGIGADPDVQRKPSDFNYQMPEAQLPSYYDPKGSDIPALEKATQLNIGALHTWYTMMAWWKSWGDDPNDPKNGIDNALLGGMKHACYAHHNSTVAAEFNVFQPMIEEPLNYAPGGSYPPLSKSMHGWHGRLQQDAQGKLLRDENGNALLWGDPGNQNPPTLTVGANPNTLFPIDGDRPMEDNCLRCHDGQREQLYRDHHYTVGLKCADCHGDMLAVSQLLAQPDGKHRQEWLDQPNCGSCHSGNGAESVAKRAYDSNDPSATPLSPKSSRFAVRPTTVQIRTGNWNQEPPPMPLKDYTSTAFRHSRDSHANLACAACHGPGHALWPNRDPKANDNVTALQLQGYTGPILECQVCHTKDAFSELAGLDAGETMQKAEGLPADSGILGGPHGMHPVNDSNWWAKADGDSTPISDGTTYGGWHDNMFHQPDLNGKDQCAACHGEDHKGTRLSKTPVDREFIVKNGKKAKWKAGEAIGCDRCHSLEKSFVGGPSGNGGGSGGDGNSGNHSPIINSSAPTNAILGETYSYQVMAGDADGDTLGYRLSDVTSGMSIDAQGKVTANWTLSQFSSITSTPFSIPFTVNVSDGKSGVATQAVTVTLGCPSNQTWIWSGTSGSCVVISSGVTITSTPPTTVVVSGKSYSYQVMATDAKSLPLTYSLSGEPSGMSINANSGLISWTTSEWTSGKFRVTATDAQGNYGFQQVTAYVCPTGTTWSDGMGGMCM
ncbi:MAG: putative Ig domain-containing protein [Methylococcus sp.]|nr:putative Ig domain-containing protein [Methylococcus sp.]